jgi:hypothetical protein
MRFRTRRRGSAGFVRGGILAAMTGVAMAVVLTGATSIAKSDYSSPYGYEKTWSSALRLVLVDFGFKVLKKDDATGYVLFEYRAPGSGPKPTNASLELVRTGGDVKVVAQIPKMPTYHEQVLLDDLAKKMHAEYGDPPNARKSPPPAAAAHDAGADPNDDEDNEHIVGSDEDNEHLVGSE